MISGEGSVSKKHVCMIVLALASGLALASCASGGGNHLDDGSGCVKRPFPQCGQGTMPNVPAQN
jgi:hypothetical protein